MRLCKLCNKKNDLMSNHIIPSFVGRYLKDTGITGYLRTSSAPNQRQQDIIKERLYCAECEGLFNSFETPFASQFFHPYHKDTSKYYRYEKWMLQFAASVCLRVIDLAVFQKNFPPKMSDQLKNQMYETREIWKSFLVGEVPHPGVKEIHLIPMDLVSDHGNVSPPANINRFIARSVMFDIPCTETEGFVFVKMAKIIVLGFINIKNRNQWKNTRLSVNNGYVHPKNMEMPGYFGEYFYGKSKHVADIQKNMSDLQLSKISADYDKNFEKFKGSEMAEAMLHDYMNFGWAAKAITEKDTEDDS